MEQNEMVNAYAVAKGSRYRLTDEEADLFLDELHRFNNAVKELRTITED